MTEQEWRDEGCRLFGPDMTQWKFACPACGHIAKAKDWHDAGAPPGAIGYSCVGRWTGQMGVDGFEGNGPCNYSGGGLIGLNPVKFAVIDDDGEVSEVGIFAFAAEEGALDAVSEEGEHNHP